MRIRNHRLKRTLVAVIGFCLMGVSACNNKKSERAAAPAAEIKLGCDAYACLKWTDINKTVLLKSNVGQLVHVSGKEYKQLVDGSQKSPSEKFDHFAFCSTSLPASLGLNDGKWYVDWLSPNDDAGIFGYNQTDYTEYLEVCHYKYGKNVT